VIAAALAAVALTRGPVVESVQPRSALVTFRTASARPAFVTLADGRRFEAGGGTEHTAPLTGLTPGRRYRYWIGTSAGLAGSGSFRAAPVGPAAFSFAVLGDYGSGSPNEYAVTRLIESWRPDFVLTLGDNSYPLGLATLLDRNIFRPFAEVFRRSAFFPAFGNHDVYLFGGRPELDAFHSLGNERWYRFGWGDASFVVLDSDLSVAPGSPQLSFARRAFRSGSCLRFAAFHHPPFSPHSTGIAPGLRRTIVPLIERRGVQVVFQGHVHSYERSRPRHGVVYLTVGTGGAEIGRYGDSTIPSAKLITGRFGALRVDVNRRSARFRFVTVDGKVRDEFRLRCG
jgi:tartrate-resistant acid phosphatase type 5